MNNKALTLYDGGGFDLMQRTASAMSASGFFKDARDQAQAIVKVMAGAELGLPPFTSMTGVHVIQGKPALGANLIATMIKNDPRYNYKIKTITDDLVEIEFFEDGESVGVSSFSKNDAQRADTKNMNKFPRNMLFARAISNGARWYTPGIFGGAPVYTPDELDAQYDEEGNIVDAVVLESSPPPQPETVVESVDDGDFEEVAPTEQELIPVYPLHVYLQDYDEGKKHVVRSLYNIDSICTKYNAPEHMMNALKKNDMVKARNQKILEAGRNDLTGLDTDLSKDTFAALAKWLIEREQG